MSDLELHRTIKYHICDKCQTVFKILPARSCPDCKVDTREVTEAEAMIFLNWSRPVGAARGEE